MSPHKLIHSTFFFNESQLRICFPPTWLKTYRTSFSLQAVCCPLVNNENLPRNDWLLKDSMLKISCQKSLQSSFLQ